MPSMDPTGKRALFEAPVDAARDLLDGSAESGRAALFSTGPARRGTAVVICERCDARTRLGAIDLAGRLVGSWFVPLRQHPHRIRCPACERRSWVRIDWSGAFGPLGG